MRECGQDEENIEKERSREDSGEALAAVRLGLVMSEKAEIRARSRISTVWSYGGS